MAQTTHEPRSLDVEMQPQQKIERMGNLKMMVLKNDSLTLQQLIFRVPSEKTSEVYWKQIVTIIVFVSVLCERQPQDPKPPNKNSDAKKDSPAVS